MRTGHHRPVMEQSTVVNVPEAGPEFVAAAAPMDWEPAAYGPLAPQRSSALIADL